MKPDITDRLRNYQYNGTLLKDAAKKIDHLRQSVTDLSEALHAERVSHNETEEQRAMWKEAFRSTHAELKQLQEKP